MKTSVTQLEVRSQPTCLLFFEWKTNAFEQVATSPEAFKNVVTNTELFETLKKKFEVTRAGDFKQHHAITISDPKKALCGPLTEVCSTCFRHIIGLVLMF